MTHVWGGGPTTSREVGRDHPLWWLDRDEGVTLIRSDAGVWSEVQSAVDSTLQAASAVLRGGYVQDVSDAHYTELVAQGYGSYFI